MGHGGKKKGTDAHPLGPTGPGWHWVPRPSHSDGNISQNTRDATQRWVNTDRIQYGGAAGRCGTKVKEIIYHGRQATATGSADAAAVQACIPYVEKWWWPQELELETGNRDPSGSWHWRFALTSVLCHLLLYPGVCITLIIFNVLILWSCNSAGSQAVIINSYNNKQNVEII